MGRAQTFVSMGDVTQADAYARRVGALVQEARGSPHPKWRKAYAVSGNSWGSDADSARGLIFEARGQYREAEAAYRRAEAFRRASLKDLDKFDYPPPPEQIVLAAEAAKPVQVAETGATLRGLPLKRRSSPQLEGIDSAELAMLPRLPDTADELKSIAIALEADPTKALYLGKDANEQKVKSLDLSGFKILAFATHGLVPGELNGLTQPALALSAH